MIASLPSCTSPLSSSPPYQIFQWLHLLSRTSYFSTIHLNLPLFLYCKLMLARFIFSQLLRVPPKICFSHFQIGNNSGGFLVSFVQWTLLGKLWKRKECGYSENETIYCFCWTVFSVWDDTRVLIIGMIMFSTLKDSGVIRFNVHFSNPLA